MLLGRKAENLVQKVVYTRVHLTKSSTANAGSSSSQGRHAARLEIFRTAPPLADLPSRGLRIVAPLLLRGTRHLAPLRDRDLISLWDALRADRALVARLCPNKDVPSTGGQRDRMLAPDPAAALACLLTANRVNQVDDFG